MFKHILLATDGSASSEHASRLAVDLARTHGAKLTALYVADPYPYIGIGELNPAGLQAYAAGLLVCTMIGALIAQTQQFVMTPG